MLWTSLVEEEGIGIVRLPSVRLKSPFFRYLYLLGRIYEACRLLKVNVIVADEFPDAAYISTDLKILLMYITDGAIYDMFELSLLHKASSMIVSDIPSSTSLPEELKTLAQHTYFVGPLLRPYRHLIGKDKRELRKELGIEPTDYLIFVTTGGCNLFPELFNVVTEALKIAKKNIPNITSIFNLGFGGREWSKHIDLPGKGNLFIKGYNRDILKYMGASDILITRGGHDTLMEAMALGMPTIAISTPLPSTLRSKERGNIERMKRLGPLIHMPMNLASPERLASELLKLLSDKELRRKAVAIQEILLKYDGSCRASELILDLCKKSVHK